MRARLLHIAVFAALLLAGCASAAPTAQPSPAAATQSATAAAEPTAMPTAAPTNAPAAEPTAMPTAAPAAEPTAMPIPEHADDWSKRPNEAAWSPDGAHFAIGFEHYVYLYDAATFELLSKLRIGEPRHDAFSIQALAFSPDGATLAVSSYENNVQLWSVPGAQLLQTLPGAGELAFSPDGTTLAVSGGAIREASVNAIQLWSLPEGTLIKTLQRDVQHYAGLVAFAPDGQTLAVVSSDNLFGAIELWSVADGTMLHQERSIDGYPNSLAFSQNGQELYVGLGGSIMQRVSVPDGARSNLIGQIGTLALAPSGQTLVVQTETNAGASAIELWELGQTEPGLSFPIGPVPPSAMALSPDGTLLLVVGRLPEIWDLGQGTLRASLAEPVRLDR